MWLKKKDFQELEARLVLLERKQEQDIKDIKKDAELEYKSIYGGLKRSSGRLNKLEYQNHTEIISQLTLIAHPEIQQWVIKYKQTYLGNVTRMVTKKDAYKLLRPDEMPDSNQDFNNSWSKYHEIFEFVLKNVDYIMQDDTVERKTNVKLN